MTMEQTLNTKQQIKNKLKQCISGEEFTTTLREYWNLKKRPPEADFEFAQQLFNN